MITEIKKTFFTSVLILAIIALIFFTTASFLNKKSDKSDNSAIIDNFATTDNPDTTDVADIADVTVVLDNLEIPWDIVFLSDSKILVTERVGQITYFDFDTDERRKINISSESEHRGEGGLLGITLHPDFEKNSYIYFYLTQRASIGLVNRVERYTWQNTSLINQKTIISNIPGAAIHDGGRISFGPDGFLYITTGDASVPSLSQNTSNLAGSILRITDDGGIPTDNPFGNEIYSFGHRNPQGIAWDDRGFLWATEHGPSAYDEINLIKKGANYGWPNSVGDRVESNTTAPILHSGNNTWAPSGAVYWDGSIFFVGLRGSAIYEAVLDGENVLELKEYYKNEFGRLRSISLGPDGMFYITTNNKDGRGNIRSGDDKIIRLNPNQFRI